MPVVKKEGKDTIIFATKEDLATPSIINLPEPEPNPGLILPNGEINWSCPCLGGMATGPCGVEFRDAFTCFHNSKTEPKGSDCFEAFKSMQNCMVQYPTVYDKDKDEDRDYLNIDDMDSDSTEEEKVNTESVTSNKNQVVKT